MSEIYLSNVRLSFPKLIEAQSAQNLPDAAKKFGADFLMAPDHPDFAKFMAEIGKVASEKWKENANTILGLIQPDRMKRCWGNGAEKIDKKTLKPYNGYEGTVYISASSNEDKPPQMIAPDGSVCDNSNTMQRQALARKLYGGCFANVAVRPWIQDNQFGRAVRCELLGVQFAADGDAFGEAPPILAFGAVQNTPPAPVSVPGFFG